MYHIICGPSAAGSLKHALRKEKQTIIEMPVNYAHGPLTDLFQPNGPTNYFNWLRQRFEEGYDFQKEDESQFKQAVAQLQTIPKGEQVILWTANNANEQTGLRLHLSLLRQPLQLYVVNLSDVLASHGIRQSGECSPDQLLHLFQQEHDLLNDTLRKTLAKEGEDILQRTEPVRIWSNQQLEFRQEDAHDAFIVACAKRLQAEQPQEPWLLLARLIGDVLGHAEDSLTDSWVNYRIRTLIQKGIFKKKGSSRWYLIRLTQQEIGDEDH